MKPKTKHLVRLSLAAMAFFVFSRATCRSTAHPESTHQSGDVQVRLKMKLFDEVRFHNMGIAFDGQYYYTINGGNSEYSDLNKYDKKGKLVDRYDLEIDGRAIFYSPLEKKLLVKPYGTSLQYVDLRTEEVENKYGDIFIEDQSHPAMSPDGRKIYELYDGTVRVYDVESGKRKRSLNLERYNENNAKGYSRAIAASDKYLFVWAPDETYTDEDGEEQTIPNANRILVYDLNGKYVTEFSLPVEGFGFSLTWANGMLWVAEDADGGADGATGIWYGYEISGIE